MSSTRHDRLHAWLLAGLRRCEREIHGVAGIIFHILLRMTARVGRRSQQHGDQAVRASAASVGESTVARLRGSHGRITLRLLIEAERQLRCTSMPVAQIAYYLGFEDPGYFTRFFTHRMGLSPRTFRARDGVELRSAARGRG